MFGQLEMTDATRRRPAATRKDLQWHSKHDTARFISKFFRRISIRRVSYPSPEPITFRYLGAMLTTFAIGRRANVICHQVIFDLN